MLLYFVVKIRGDFYGVVGFLYILLENYDSGSNMIGWM